MAGTDYDAASGSLTFSASQTTQTVTVQTHLDGNAGDNLSFSVVLTDPGANNTPPGPGTLNFINSTGSGIIEKVCGEVAIYNPDGTASDNGTVDVGECVPMMVRLTSPAVVDGQFMLSYDTDYFKITTDAAGNNVVAPDTTTFTASTGGTQLYLWGVAPTSDPSGSQITLEYGDPVPIANQNVVVPAAERITRTALNAPGNSFAAANWHFQLAQAYQDANGTQVALDLIQKIVLDCANRGFRPYRLPEYCQNHVLRVNWSYPRGRDCDTGPRPQ